MKTVFIDCSPKKKLSASGFIAGLTEVFVFGNTVKEKLRTRGDYERVLESIHGADNIVFSMPLYVDGVPSHVLPFLKRAEDFLKDNDEEISVYVIANNGFIEGKQNEPLMQVMENFCDRSGLQFKGGLGIGGGVMMNVLRIMLMVYLVILLINLVLSAVQTGTLLHAGPFLQFARQVLWILIFGCGILVFDLWLAMCINKSREYGRHYTRIMLPSIVFILAADIFFTVISVINLGIFRGWFSAKKPAE